MFTYHSLFLSSSISKELNEKDLSWSAVHLTGNADDAESEAMGKKRKRSVC